MYRPGPLRTRMNAKLSEAPLPVAEVEATRGESKQQPLGLNGHPGERGERCLEFAQARVCRESGQRV